MMKNPKTELNKNIKLDEMVLGFDLRFHHISIQLSKKKTKKKKLRRQIVRQVCRFREYEIGIISPTSESKKMSRFSGAGWSTYNPAHQPIRAMTSPDVEYSSMALPQQPSK